MMNLVRMELYLGRRSFWIGGLVIVLYQLLLAGMAEAYMNNPDIINLMKAKSKLIEMVGMDLSMMSSYEGWMGGQAYTFYVLLLGAFAAIWSASGIAKEKDRRTSEYLFSLPYSRDAIFYSKAAAQWIQLTAIAAASFAAIWLGGVAFSEVNDVGSLLALTLGGYLTALAFAGIGNVLTVFLSSERAALTAGIGIVMVMFLLNMLSSLTEEVRWLAGFSLFRAFVPKDVIGETGLTAAPILITIGLYAAGLFIGRMIVKRQDL